MLKECIVFELILWRCQRIEKLSNFLENQHEILRINACTAFNLLCQHLFSNRELFHIGVFRSL